MAAWVPVIGLAALAALIATGGLRDRDRAVPQPKRLVSQEKTTTIGLREPGPDKSVERIVTMAATAGDPLLRPVARATAPGSTGDGSLRVAASLVEAPAPPPPAPKIAASKPPDSPGKQAAAASPKPAAPEQLAALTPTSPPLPAWRLYAQHVNAAETGPSIALIVAGADDSMDRAIESLPPAVSLTLDPYGRHLPEWVAAARAKGHEVLLTLSAPPIAGGRHDAGPMAILSSLDPKENLARLDWALNRTVGFVGVVDIAGNHPAAETAPILAKLGERGLMMVSGTPLKETRGAVPLAAGDVVISPDLSRRETDERFAALLDKAKRDGHAVGIVIVDNALLRRLEEWLAALRHQAIALTPATATIAPRLGTGIAAE